MIHHLPNGQIIRARAEHVYADLDPGSVSCVHSDGAYGKDMGVWDNVRVEDLPSWYRPHIAAWGRVCAPAASVYLWNTHEGWAAIHPEMLAAGWTLRAVITWDKGPGFLAGKVDTLGAKTWLNVTEVCGFYQREPSETELWNRWGATHPVRLYLEAARVRAGRTLQEIDVALQVDGMARHWFTWSQWCLPSSEKYERLRELLPGLDRDLGELRAEHAALWAEHRAAWERVRAPFTLPMSVTNVWDHPHVQGAERLTGADGKPLHACQKPLLFARRVLEASTRPGELILEPFAGTCRIAFAAEDLARTEPDQARRYVCVEADEDGRNYVEHVLGDLRGERPAWKRPANQMSLFGT